MKKLIAMLLCICMMLGLVACGAPAAKDAAATEAPETVQAEQPAAEAEKNDDAVAESEPAETETTRKRKPPSPPRKRSPQRFCPTATTTRALSW